MCLKTDFGQNLGNYRLWMILLPQKLILMPDCLMVYLLKSLFYLLIKGSLKIQNDFCPNCGSNALRKNGTIHNNKAKSECKNCGYQFVINNTKKIVTQTQKDQGDKLLLEKISLRGIARVVGVSWRWLQNYVNHRLAQVPRKIEISDKLTEGSLAEGNQAEGLLGWKSQEIRTPPQLNSS